MDGPSRQLAPVGGRLTFVKNVPDRVPTFGELRQRMWNKVSQRPVRVGVLATLLSFTLLWSLFCVWVHYSFEGYYYGPFLISDHYPIPQEAAKAGIKPVLTREQGVGWDGQFYYHQSNDLFLRHDTAQALDTPSYRYQRIGIPLVANLGATLMGKDITPPGFYHLVQFLLVSLGSGVLAGWLVSQGENPWWTVVWVGSMGVIHSLFHGLPDAPCDALFILSFVGLLTRRLLLYTPAAILLLLCREGYAAFSAVVFLATALNLLRWRHEHWLWRCFWTGFPGAILLGWAVFVAGRLGTPILEGSRSVPWGGLVDYPFVAFYNTLLQAWEAGNAMEAKTKVLSAGVLISVGWLILRCAGKVPVFLTALPYLMITTMTGSIVWEVFGGHQKALGTILVLGVFLLPWHRGWLFRVVLLMNLVVSVDVLVSTKIWHTPFYSPHLVELSRTEPVPPGRSNPPLTDCRSEVTVREIDSTALPYEGIWKAFHRSSSLFEATVTNHSTATWYLNPKSGTWMGVSLGWVLQDEEGKHVREGRVPLPQEVAPGETVEIKFAVPPPAGSGNFILRTSVIQDGNRWFHDVDPSFGHRLPLRFPR